MTETEEARTSALRVLVVGLAVPPETFIARLLRGLAEAGVQVTVGSGLRPQGEWFLHRELKWLPLPPVGGPRAPRVARGAALMATAALRSPRHLGLLARSARHATSESRQLARCLYRVLPFVGRSWDVVYFPCNSAAISYEPLFDLGCPVVISARAKQMNVAPHDPQRQVQTMALRRSFARASRVHCVSENMKRQVMALGLEPERARVIYAGIPTDFFKPEPKRSPAASAEFRLCTIGEYEWRKGQEYALMTMDMLRKRGVLATLDIVGDGPERQRLAYTIADLGLESCVRLLGRMDVESVRDRLWQADAFLLSSVNEGLPNVLVEAMACGLPVVTTDTGGTGEAVTDGAEGYVLPVRDPAGAADAIVRLADNPEVRLRMGEAARVRAVRQFAIEPHVQGFLALFREAAAAGRAGGDGAA